MKNSISCELVATTAGQISIEKVKEIISSTIRDAELNHKRDRYMLEKHFYHYVLKHVLKHSYSSVSKIVNLSISAIQNSISAVECRLETERMTRGLFLKILTNILKADISLDMNERMENFKFPPLIKLGR